jgi:tetratricopeptide (TPR) repeat protein
MEGNAELLALQRLDETCAQLQKAGNYLEALECMERGLVLRQHFFGAESDEVWTACKTVGEMCNLLAMTYLQQEDFNMVLELLKKAEILTERDLPGRAATFNNLACYYRRQGKLHAALQYLQKALKIESKLSNVQNPADTHINACAVLSQLGRHQTALEHAQQALILLQEELLAPPGSTEAAAPPQADRIAVLAIAYHNIGVEQEFLKRYDQSMLSYRKGVEVAERYLGAKHAICITLKNSIVAAKKAAAASAAKNKGPRAAAAAAATAPGGRGTKAGTHPVTGMKKLRDMAGRSPQGPSAPMDESMDVGLSAPMPSAPAPKI